MMQARRQFALAVAFAATLSMAAPAAGQDGPASDLLEKTFPALHDAIWAVPSADNVTKQAITAVFSAAVEMSAADAAGGALEQAFGISLRTVLQEAAANPSATAQLAFDEFGKGLAVDAAVSAAAALVADLVLKHPFFDDISPDFRNILRALIRSILEEGYGVAMGLTSPGAAAEAVRSGLVDRALDVYAIARESRAVVNVQRAAFVANAQSVEAAAQVAMLRTPRAGQVAMDTVRQAQDTLAAMVGASDAEAMREIVNMGFIALLAQKRGDTARARSFADQMLATAEKADNIGVFSAFVRPLDMLLALNREGFRDIPSEAAFVMVSTTSLRLLFEENDGSVPAAPPPVEPAPVAPAPKPSPPPPPLPVADGIWGPEIVFVGDLEYLPCGDRDTTPDCLKELGFSDQAAAFSKALDGDYAGMGRAVEFRELGPVDLAATEYQGASVFVRPVLLNGTPDFFIVAPTADPVVAFRDEASLAMLRRYPQASSRDHVVVGHRVLSDGTQRFVLSESMTDQCRACDIVGSAVTFLDVGAATDGQVVRIPVGLHLTGPGYSDQVTARDMTARPDLLQLRLNLLGYQAGEMDGIAGPSTRTALMEFQVQHCLIPTGEPDAETAEALARATGFDTPCAGAEVPVGLAANTPLRQGVYVDDPALCQLDMISPDEVFQRQITITTEGGVMWGYEDGCTTTRTDIRDGVTLFRASCMVGVEEVTGNWTFDLQSNEAFLYRPTDGQPQQSFSRCGDDSRLSAAVFGTSTASAKPFTVLEDGIYVTNPAICSALPSANAFRDVRVIAAGQADLGVGEFCLFGEPSPSAGALEYAAHCPFSEDDYVATWRWRPTSTTSFVEERGLFPDHPDAPWGLEFSRCEQPTGATAPVLESPDLFNLFESLLAGNCAGRAVCKLVGVDGSYALRALDPAGLSLAAATQSFLISYEQGVAQGLPILPSEAAFSTTDGLYMIRRTGCTGGDCATAVMIIFADRIGSPPGSSGYMGYALEMPPGWVPSATPVSQEREITHRVPGFENQGIVYVMDLALRRVEGGVYIRLSSATARFNPDANFNAVSPLEVFDMGLQVVARRNCEGCRPDFVEQAPVQYRFINGQLEQIATPTEVFVPDAVLAANDLVGFAFYGQTSDKGLLFLNGTDLRTANLLDWPD